MAIAIQKKNKKTKKLNKVAVDMENNFEVADYVDRDWHELGFRTCY